MSTPTIDPQHQWPHTPPQEPHNPTPTSTDRRRGRAGTAALVAAVALASGLSGGAFATWLDDEAAASSTRPAATAPVGKTASAIDVPSVLAKVEPAVVTVRTKAISPDAMMNPVAAEGAGTGFILRENGVIVTNSHVVAGATSITVTTADGETMDARVLGHSASQDLAVLKVDAEDLPTVELGNSKTMQVGDPVVAIGNALGLPGGPTVTEGIISARDRSITTDRGATLENLLQTDAAINPGNSGGPLVDSEGRVIGINTAGAANGQNIGFAIAISSARETINDLADGKTVTRPFIGVQMAPVDESVQRQFGLETDSGALIVGVTAGSPAENAGVRTGDVLVEINGTDVRRPTTSEARSPSSSPVRRSSSSCSAARGARRWS